MLLFVFRLGLGEFGHNLLSKLHQFSSPTASCEPLIGCLAILLRSHRRAATTTGATGEPATGVATRGVGLPHPGRRRHRHERGRRETAVVLHRTQWLRPRSAVFRTAGEVWHSPSGPVTELCSAMSPCPTGLRGPVVSCDKTFKNKQQIVFSVAFPKQIALLCSLLF